MKKIFALLAAFILCISCSSDDDSDQDGGDINLIGTWLLTSFTTETAFDLDNDGDSSNDLLIETGCLQNETLVFAIDNTATAFSTTFLDIFVNIAIGDDGSEEFVQIVNCEEDNFVTQLTWSINGNTVTISDGEETFNAIIDGDELSFVLPEGSDLEVIEGDAIVDLIEDVTLTYTLQ